MAFNRRQTAEFRTAGMGATIYSPYWIPTSVWNSSIFVVKKKCGKWRMMIDLRAVNKSIQPMGPLQYGIPLPSLLPNQ